MPLLFECREQTGQAIDRLTPDMDLDPRVRMQLHIEHGVAHVFTMGSVKKAHAALQVGYEIAVSLDDANAEMRALWALWVLNGLSSNFNAVRSAAVIAAKPRAADSIRRAGRDSGRGAAAAG